MHLRETDSTNTVALHLAEQGAPAWTLVTADYQTAGRGRAGHEWSAPPGVSLLASVVLRPTLCMDRLPLLTIACGIALSEAVEACTGLAARLKWPNDLLISGRKAAGILCESTATPQGLAVVAGFGVNVNTKREDLPERTIFPATSLLAEAPEGTAPFDRDGLCRALLECLKKNCALLEEEAGDRKICTCFTRRDALDGRTLSADVPGGEPVTGKNLGIFPDGTLCLLTENGPRKILAASISVSP